MKNTELTTPAERDQQRDCQAGTPPAADRERPWRASPLSPAARFATACEANEAAILSVIQRGLARQMSQYALRGTAKDWMTRSELDVILKSLLRQDLIEILAADHRHDSSPIIRFVNRDAEVGK